MHSMQASGRLHAHQSMFSRRSVTLLMLSICAVPTFVETEVEPQEPHPSLRGTRLGTQPLVSHEQVTWRGECQLPCSGAQRIMCSTPANPRERGIQVEVVHVADSALGSRCVDQDAHCLDDAPKVVDVRPVQRVRAMKGL
jgi:hypothetical protein